MTVKQAEKKGWFFTSREENGHVDPDQKALGRDKDDRDNSVIVKPVFSAVKLGTNAEFTFEDEKLLLNAIDVWETTQAQRIPTEENQ